VLGRRGKIRPESEALPLVDLLGHLLDPGSRPAERVQAVQLMERGSGGIDRLKNGLCAHHWMPDLFAVVSRQQVDPLPARRRVSFDVRFPMADGVLGEEVRPKAARFHESEVDADRKRFLR